MNPTVNMNPTMPAFHPPHLLHRPKTFQDITQPSLSRSNQILPNQTKENSESVRTHGNPMTVSTPISRPQRPKLIKQFTESKPKLFEPESFVGKSQVGDSNSVFMPSTMTSASDVWTISANSTPLSFPLFKTRTIADHPLKYISRYNTAGMTPPSPSRA